MNNAIRKVSCNHRTVARTGLSTGHCQTTPPTSNAPLAISILLALQLNHTRFCPSFLSSLLPSSGRYILEEAQIVKENGW